MRYQKLDTKRKYYVCNIFGKNDKSKTNIFGDKNVVLVYFQHGVGFLCSCAYSAGAVTECKKYFHILFGNKDEETEKNITFLNDKHSNVIETCDSYYYTNLHITNYNFLTNSLYLKMIDGDI